MPTRPPFDRIEPLPKASALPKSNVLPLAIDITPLNAPGLDWLLLPEIVSTPEPVCA